jgi:hypothetical protein
MDAVLGGTGVGSRYPRRLFVRASSRAFSPFSDSHLDAESAKKPPLAKSDTAILTITAWFGYRKCPKPG